MLLAKQENCADTEIITAGTKLIYYLRQFLTQERMVFSYASSYTDEKKEQQFGSYDIPMEKVMEKLRVNLKDEEILFAGYLNDYKDVQKKIASFSSLYKHLLSLGIDEGNVWKKQKNVLIDNTMHKEGFFHEQADKKAMYVYSGAKHQKSYYYNMEKSKYYNKGWLYEWAKALSEGEGNRIKWFDLKQAILSDEDGILERLFSFSGGVDSEKGSLVGDYARIVSGRRQQVQAKNENKKIITINQLWDTLKQINDTLCIMRDFVQTTQPQQLGNSITLRKQIKNLYGSYNLEINKTLESLFQPLEKFAKS